MAEGNLPAPHGGGEIILYKTQDGQTRIDVRLDGQTVWLTQAQMAELFQTTPQNITLHIKNIYDEGELLRRIRDIRSSEKVFWRKVLDIYATSVDYDKDADVSQQFFATVQNKMHWAAHGHTAAEIIHKRADAMKPNMGLTCASGERVR